MIWIDSSFAIAWLLGEKRAQSAPINREQGTILSAQYAETLIYFSRRLLELQPVVAQLEVLNLEQPTKKELVYAAQLYTQARTGGHSKLSLADAILGAVAKTRKEAIFTFDADFKEIGFSEEELGVWM